MFLIAPYMAFVHKPALLHTVWRRDSCCWRFTPPLLKALPRQLNSQPLHRILDPGEKESRAEEETCSFFSLSRGLSYDFPNKCEPRETVWMAIHQAGCLHPPEQCVTPPGTKKVTRGFTSTFVHPVHTQPHPVGGSKPWETTQWRTGRILH